MQVSKLHEQLGIKPAMKHSSAEARTAALEAVLGINFQPKVGGVAKKKREAPKKLA